jgi:hypothetical protein
MMIRVNGEYLDFNDDIEIESQIKLFQDIETTDGDFSYSFELAQTNKNLKALGLPFPDTIKSIYSDVECEIIDNTGYKVHKGSLRVDRNKKSIACTFFGGNNNWFSLLNVPLTSLPLYKYDVNLTEANIISSWTQDKGLVFPILDTGAIVTRSYYNLKTEDFTGLFYVKTIFKEIFNAQGIKIQGDLLEDSTFNMLTIASNGKSQDDIRNRTSYVNKTTSQLAVSNVRISFQDDFTFPYSDGSQNNYNTSVYAYTADVKMLVRVAISINVAATVGAPNLSVFSLLFRINEVTDKSFSYQVNTTGGVLSRVVDISLEAFEELTVRLTVTAFNSVNITAGNIKITPIYVYRVFGNSSVPNWTQGKFVSNILRIFNVLPSFDADSRTLTLDLFNKIKTKDPIDVSDEIEIDEIDYSDFVSNYAKSNLFQYKEGSDEDLRIYNIANTIRYGSGDLPVDNDFIQQSADVVKSDFTAPITYLNGVFDSSMERINFVELEELDERPITSVTDSSGTPRFNITNTETYFQAGDVIRIKMDTVTAYNGDWVIRATTNTYLEVNGLSFNTSDSGTCTLLRHKFTSDDNVYLFVNVPNVNNLFYSSNQSFYINRSTTFMTSALAYFNLLSNGRQINLQYKQSLSFGTVENPISYQLTILQTYWGIFSDILSDPVMLRIFGYFKQAKFLTLKTFLRPLRIKTNQTNNLYYLNRITGYKSGHQPCEGELIKL